LQGVLTFSLFCFPYQVCESYNNVFGRTLNPHKLCLTPGGSSSGEAATIGLRGSLMGVGSDIAGSVRVPAALTGCFGFKPTAHRLPWAGQAHLMPKGWTGILPTLGPLATSADDLTLFMRTVIQARPWVYDSSALALPWHHVPRKQNLNVAVWLQDPEFPVLPPVARTMASAAAKLKAAGHNVRILDPASVPSTMRAMKISMRSFALDTENLAHTFLAAAGEDPIPDLAAMNPADYLDADFKPDLAENLRVSAALHDYRHEWAQIWRDGDLDVLICPASRGTAVPHGEFGPLMYTILWNLLDVQ
jgi:amidase